MSVGRRITLQCHLGQLSNSRSHIEGKYFTIAIVMALLKIVTVPSNKLRGKDMNNT
jgi:hypothetical protein